MDLEIILDMLDNLTTEQLEEVLEYINTMIENN